MVFSVAHENETTAEAMTAKRTVLDMNLILISRFGLQGNPALAGFVLLLALLTKHLSAFFRKTLVLFFLGKISGRIVPLRLARLELIREG